MLPRNAKAHKERKKPFERLTIWSNNLTKLNISILYVFLAVIMLVSISSHTPQGGRTAINAVELHVSTNEVNFSNDIGYMHSRIHQLFNFVT